VAVTLDTSRKETGSSV